MNIIGDQVTKGMLLCIRSLEFHDCIGLIYSQGSGMFTPIML